MTDHNKHSNVECVTLTNNARIVRVIGCPDMFAVRKGGKFLKTQMGTKRLFDDLDDAIVAATFAPDSEY